MAYRKYQTQDESRAYKKPYTSNRTYVKKTAKVFDVYAGGSRFQVCACDLKALLDSLRINGATYRIESFEVAV